MIIDRYAAPDLERSTTYSYTDETVAAHERRVRQRINAAGAALLTVIVLVGGLGALAVFWP